MQETGSTTLGLPFLWLLQGAGSYRREAKGFKVKAQSGIKER
jgi:hypothetical protein